jgi:zinc protease
MHTRLRTTLAVTLFCAFAIGQAVAKAPQIVTLDSKSPLLEIRVMVKAGSAHDPAGMEGLAAITANAVLEASFGDAAKPTTKEMLASITSPWGSGARPEVLLGKESTTFSMTVPREVLDAFVAQIFAPMFTQPHFAADEVSRLLSEAKTQISSSLRYENIEFVGLEAIDNYLFDGTSYAHPVGGSVRGLDKITPDAARAFYGQFYQPGNMILGVSTTDEAVIDKLSVALAAAGKPEGKRTKLAFAKPSAPAPVSGREMTVVGMPDAGATAIHLAFPLPVDRTHEDFWPLYVAGVYFGTHRDGHGQLYELIRQERGYNYGDYAYVEHFAYRPYYLFQPFNTPRTQQYFSIWIRPVGDDYAHHLLKAAVCELENLVVNGVTAQHVEASKNKAKVLYLNLAETGSRLLEARVDDAWWGMSPGYLDGYLARIDAVTTEQVNDVVRRYLSAENLKIVVVTDAEKAQAFADAVLAGGVATGKTLADYQVASHQQDGETIYELPESRVRTLQRDALWANYRLGIGADRVQVVPVEALFESGKFVEPSVVEAGAR